MALKKVSSTTTSSHLVPKAFHGPGRLLVTSKRAGAAPTPPGYTIIDVDRTNPILGNHLFSDTPKNLDERRHQIDTFRTFLYSDSVEAEKARSALDAIGKRVEKGERIALRCWCAPQDCHARVEHEYIMKTLTLRPEPSSVDVPASIALYPWAMADAAKKNVDLLSAVQYEKYRAVLQDIDLQTVPKKGSIKTWFDVLKSTNVKDIIHALKSSLSYEQTQALFLNPLWHNDVLSRIGLENYDLVVSTLMERVTPAVLGHGNRIATYFNNCLELLANDHLSPSTLTILSDLLVLTFRRLRFESGSNHYASWVSTWIASPTEERVLNHPHTQAFYQLMIPVVSDYFRRTMLTLNYETVAESVNPMPALPIGVRQQIFHQFDAFSRAKYAEDFHIGSVKKPFPDWIHAQIVSELNTMAFCSSHWSEEYSPQLNVFFNELDDASFEACLQKWKIHFDQHPPDWDMAIVLPKIAVDRQRAYSNILHLETAYIASMLGAVTKYPYLKKQLIGVYSEYLGAGKDVTGKHILPAQSPFQCSLEDLCTRYEHCRSIHDAFTPTMFIHTELEKMMPALDVDELPGNAL